MEEATRSVEDFNVVVAKWDHLDRNRERNERRREIRRDADTLISNFENNLEEYKNVQQSKYAVNRNNQYTYGMAAFGGIAPNYRIVLKDKPTLSWEFFSLLRRMQLMFSFMITDDKRPLRFCKHCEKAFIAGHISAALCSPKCKNQYNVYKSRSKKNNTD